MRQSVTGWVSLVVAVIPLTAYAQQPLTKEEIDAAFVGKTVTFESGATAHYAPDGTYSYVPPVRSPGGKGTSLSNIYSGRYVISDGKICWVFQAQTNQRCRTVVRQNGSFAFVDPDGKSYPVKSLQ